VGAGVGVATAGVGDGPALGAEPSACLTGVHVAARVGLLLQLRAEENVGEGLVQPDGESALLLLLHLPAKTILQERIHLVKGLVGQVLPTLGAGAKVVQEVFVR